MVYTPIANYVQFKSLVGGTSFCLGVEFDDRGWEMHVYDFIVVSV